MKNIENKKIDSNISFEGNSGYDFTNEWFLGNVYGRGNEVNIVEIWENLLKKRDIFKVIEIGSYEGRSATFLIELLGNQNESEIYCVDTWSGSMEHAAHKFNEIEMRFDKNIQVAKSKSLNKVDVHKLKMTSVQAIAKLIHEGHAESFDLVYIDGSHQSIDVLTDAVSSFNLLKHGGLIIFDDYLWDFGYRKTGSVLSTPKIGIDSFINVFYEKIRVIHGYPSYQMYCEKR